MGAELEVKIAASFAELSKHCLAMAEALEAITALHHHIGGLCNACDRFWPCPTYLAAISWAKP